MSLVSTASSRVRRDGWRVRPNLLDSTVKRITKHFTGPGVVPVKWEMGSQMTPLTLELAVRRVCAKHLANLDWLLRILRLIAEQGTTVVDAPVQSGSDLDAMSESVVTAIVAYMLNNPRIKRIEEDRQALVASGATAHVTAFHNGAGSLRCPRPVCQHISP
jgi:hypothetical protein